MTISKTIIATVLFVGFSSSVLAVNGNGSGCNQQTLGAVSASATTLDSLSEQLAQKAEAAGASSFKIVSAGGNNMLHGTAVLYK